MEYSEQIRKHFTPAHSIRHKIASMGGSNGESSCLLCPQPCPQLPPHVPRYQEQLPLVLPHALGSAPTLPPHRKNPGAAHAVEPWQETHLVYFCLAEGKAAV